MISCISYDNIHRSGLAFSSQFQLRHRCFIDRQKYKVSTYNGMEYDQYDTPAAVYFVYTDNAGSALGCSRLTPVSQGSMLQDLWPEMVDKPAEVFRTGVWEGTRFCIDKSLQPSFRLRVCQEIVLAYLEFGLLAGIEKVIGVMPPRILNTVFGNAGCQYENIGRKKLIDGCTIQAASLDVSRTQLENVRAATGIMRSVFDGSLGQQKIAA